MSNAVLLIIVCVFGSGLACGWVLRDLYWHMDKRTPLHLTQLKPANRNTAPITPKPPAPLAPDFKNDPWFARHNVLDDDIEIDRALRPDLLNGGNPYTAGPGARPASPFGY